MRELNYSCATEKKKSVIRWPHSCFHGEHLKKGGKVLRVCEYSLYGDHTFIMEVCGGKYEALDRMKDLMQQHNGAQMRVVKWIHHVFNHTHTIRWWWLKKAENVDWSLGSLLPVKDIAECIMADIILRTILMGRNKLLSGKRGREQAKETVPEMNSYSDGPAGPVTNLWVQFDCFLVRISWWIRILSVCILITNDNVLSHHALHELVLLP